MAENQSFSIDTKMTGAKAKTAGTSLGIFALVFLGSIYLMNKVQFLKTNRLIAGGFTTLLGFFLHAGQNKAWIKTGGSALFASGLLGTTYGLLNATRTNKEGEKVPLLPISSKVLEVIKDSTQLNGLRGSIGMGNTYNNASAEIQRMLEQGPASAPITFKGEEQAPARQSEWL